MTADRPMQLGMVGLGRMGSNLVRRLIRDGHRCVGYDRTPAVVKSLEAEGATGANSYEELVRKLDRPRTVLASVEEGIPATVITASLYERFESRRAGEFTDKILSAMRSEFGGHAEKAR
jgi:6-phosphogluconate dehydrogenase